MNAERQLLVKAKAALVFGHDDAERNAYDAIADYLRRNPPDPLHVPEPEPVTPSLLERIGAWWRRLGG